MQPLDNAEGPTPGKGSALNSAPYSTRNAAGKTTRSPGARHVPGQLPIVVAATIFPPATGRKLALITPDEQCPGCGEWHDHRCPWPAPVLVDKRARCGARYELLLHRPKVSKRGRRVRAVA